MPEEDAGQSQAGANPTPMAASAGTGGAAPPPESPNALQLSEDERCPFGCEPRSSPLAQKTVTRDHPPPALSGGTLLTTRDGKWLVAADPDRDRLYFVDLAGEKLSHVRDLAWGAEPGRLIEDDVGRIHVALRGTGALLTLTRERDSELTERALCKHPRGLAYDASTKTVHAACAGGELVSIGAEPSAPVQRKIELDRDLRDVLVRGSDLLVTRFRSAETLRIGADGRVSERKLPPTFLQLERANSGALNENTQAPTVGWRAIDIPGKGSALLHQRARLGAVRTDTGAYNS
ncbi:MAG TPA: hypothetical protein VMF89_24290, partial [Polyangiales bacterium]|nr:hypothetical protein [Polyangiales bacterium]